MWDVVGFVAGLLVLLLGVLGLVGGGSSEALDPKLREHRATVFLGANQARPRDGTGRDAAGFI